MVSEERLPCEVVEQVLAFLPVPDLCRYRSVCKRWNSLICSPEFGTRCLQNATNGVTEGACFVVKLWHCIDSAQSGARRKVISSWSIFDLDTRRWYNVEDTLPKGFDYHVAAMDAGIICTFGNALTDEQRRASTIDSSITMEPQILVVANLIGKSMRVLPNPPLHVPLRETNLKLVVDNVSQAYKIFLISVGVSWGPPQDRHVCVYDSSTAQWRTSPIPLVNPVNWPVHIAVYEGALYLLFPDYCGWAHRLYSYNDFADSWEDTGVKIGQDSPIMMGSCDLVVSNNRLFLINKCLIDQTLMDQRDGPNIMKFPNHWTYTPFWPLDISEISLSEKHCKTVVQLTQAEVYQHFGTQAPYDPEKFSFGREIQAHGFDNSILLTMKMHGESGKYVLYNLVIGLWEVLPPNPVELLHCEDGNRGTLWKDGDAVTAYLRLPNTPWG